MLEADSPIVMLFAALRYAKSTPITAHSLSKR
jgi:hypothetical protein